MSRSAIDGALVRWMPLSECMTAMYVRPGTLAAGLLLAAAEKRLAEARAEHERMADVGEGESSKRKVQSSKGRKSPSPAAEAATSPRAEPRGEGKEEERQKRKRAPTPGCAGTSPLGEVRGEVRG